MRVVEASTAEYSQYVHAWIFLKEALGEIVYNDADNGFFEENCYV